ncbi:23S rRNA pseudouridine2605 synthase [Mucilaginibacter mallensis]|uniref:Pseudouridine synthase n=1 Tax=Mucilaginibacter mallensis TaxID=652787 RepID=A0A1H2C187_MUCMA|nr:pseudouridine synthase [Mucilaginibacter mallensis]SDT64201.1 23S rRNA pseudouridine2605 synthase [Mucilaginibacter mallensis]
MVFKRPGNSRDDKSNQSSGRRSGGTEGSKKSFSASRGRSTGSPDRADSKRAPKSFSNEKQGEKRSYSSSGSSKPYAGKGDGENRSSFTGGEKKTFVPRNKPYTGRPADSDDRAKKSFGSDSGEKRQARSKPYSGRVSSADDKPSFASRNKSYSGRAGSSDDRPKRSFGGDEGGERKSRPTSSGPRERSGDRKFAGKPAEGGFKKRADAGDKPYRKTDKPVYDKITRDKDAPVKTLRGRKEKENKDSGLIRLNRYIANAGICSRRKADELIEAGVVSVNGEVVSELGHKIDPIKDEIRYNGELLKREKMVYVLLNKPKDYITTTEDPQERRTVMHLVEKASRERIYPIGRLDRNTTGLLLMTNDGDLADKLSHPRSNVTKLYQVELSKALAQGDMNKIQYGLELEDGLIKPDSISYVTGGTKREIGIQIHSGKNRIVRRIFEHLGYEVVKLDRVIYAGLTKKDLTRGRWRYLDEKEIIQLKHLIQ